MKRQLTGAAQAAAAIRAELKKVFPGIKFSVRSDNFSMGDSVDISWNDGATVKEVDEVVNKYQYGSFDGMTDMYSNTNSRNDIPQAKYVQTHRTISPEVKAILLPFAEEIVKDIQDNINASTLIHRIFYKTPIPTGATVTGLQENGKTSGCGIEEFYSIAYTLPETESRPVSVEVPADEVQVIQYSPKSIAVIGNTRPIKDKLKAIGGSFNPRLTCGAGWIFPMGKLEALKELLTGETAPEEAPEPQLRHPELPTDHPLNICDPSGGQYKEALKEYQEVAPWRHPELMDEVQKTVQMFADIDQKIYGEVQESTREAARVQEVEIYDNLQDITEAANSGKVISLCNLSELVNKK